jgi:hypothetical protein
MGKKLLYLILFSCAGLGASAAHAQSSAGHLWGITRGCALDAQTTQELSRRLAAIGVPVDRLDQRSPPPGAGWALDAGLAELRRASGLSEGWLLGGHIEEQRIARTAGERELWQLARLWIVDLDGQQIAYTDHPYRVSDAARGDLDLQRRRGDISSRLANVALRLIEQPIWRPLGQGSAAAARENLCSAVGSRVAATVPAATPDRVAFSVQAAPDARKHRAAVIDSLKRHFQDTGRSLVETDLSRPSDLSAAVSRGQANFALRIALQTQGQVQFLIAHKASPNLDTSELDCLGCPMEEMSRRVVQASGALIDRHAARELQPVSLAWPREVCQQMTFPSCAPRAAVDGSGEDDEPPAPKPAPLRMWASREGSSLGLFPDPQTYETALPPPTPTRWTHTLSRERKIAAAVLGSVGGVLLLATVIETGRQYSSTCNNVCGIEGATVQGLVGGGFGISAALLIGTGLVAGIPTKETISDKR